MENLCKHPDVYLSDKNFSIETVAEALKEGCLTLFIGAGISKSASNGFPKWNELVKICFEKRGLSKKKGIPFDDKKAGLSKKSKTDVDNEYLLDVMEDVQADCSSYDEYLQLVKESLYDYYYTKRTFEYDNALMRKELLVAIGSIIMGSVRGNANCVINYNFDDLFEWYLDYHGFKTQVISEYPKLILKSDVNIYHPHGFLPLMKKYDTAATSSIILSKNEYETITAEEVNPYNEFQRHILSTKCGLFIGMSGDDKHLSSLCNYVYTKEASINKQRILGFIILLNNKANKAREDANSRRGLINLYIDSYDELPEFLLSICRKSAAL